MKYREGLWRIKQTTKTPERQVIIITAETWRSHLITAQQELISVFFLLILSHSILMLSILCPVCPLSLSTTIFTFLSVVPLVVYHLLPSLHPPINSQCFQKPSGMNSFLHRFSSISPTDPAEEGSIPFAFLSLLFLSLSLILFSLVLLRQQVISVRPDGYSNFPDSQSSGTKMKLS